MLNPNKNCKNPKCTQINPQPLTDFYKAKSNPDGLQYWCKSCILLNNANYHKKHREERKQYHKDYAQTLRGKAAGKKGRKKYLKTPKGEAAQDKYAKSPKGKKARARITQVHRQTQEGKAAHCAIQAKRRAVKLQATPKWLTPEQLLEIKGFYIRAAQKTKETGIKHHVDHMFPLQAVDENGVRVGSGLHVPDNLQILTERENCSKNDKLIPEILYPILS